MVLEKTLESPLDCKEIKPVNPKGNQSWILFGRTDTEAEAPILWAPDAKSWLTGKDLDARKDWRQEEKGMTEDEMVGWHHWLNRHQFEQNPGVGDGQGSLVWCSPWGCRVGHDSVTELNWTEWHRNRDQRNRKTQNLFAWPLGPCAVGHPSASQGPPPSFSPTYSTLSPLPTHSTIISFAKKASEGFPGGPVGRRLDHAMQGTLIILAREPWSHVPRRDSAQEPQLLSLGSVTRVLRPRGKTLAAKTRHRQMNNFFFLKAFSRTSLVVQHLRICLPMQGTWVRFLKSRSKDPTYQGANKSTHCH